MLFTILLVPRHLSSQSLHYGQLHCNILHWLWVLVLKLVQQEQVVPEEPKDYKQAEGCIQSTHVNHQYHHCDHHTIANHHHFVISY